LAGALLRELEQPAVDGADAALSRGDLSQVA
jgi:hypothetical protein